MSTWKETTLGELVGDGFILNHNNKRVPLSSDVRLKMQGEYPYYGAASAIDYIDSYKFDGFYLLIAEDGTVFDGKSPMLQLVSGKFWVSNHSHVLQGKNEQATKLLYYILRNVSISPYITGAVQPKLTKENLYSISFPFPESEADQVGVVKILGSLDDKIELLREENKTFETTAQAIFKEWFVNFEFPVTMLHSNTPPRPLGTPPLEGNDTGAGLHYSPPTEGWQALPDGVVPTPPLEEYPKGAVVDSRDTTHYMSLPYNPKLRDRAKALRKAGNLAEVLFWQQVKGRQFLGLDFDRQKIVGNYIVDFYCPNRRVVVEIDGSSHDDKEEYDQERDVFLESLGLGVIHITDTDVKKNLSGVMEWLREQPVFQSQSTAEMRNSASYASLTQIHHPVRQSLPPLHERGIFSSSGGVPAGGGGYKSAGGKMIDSELGEIPEGWRVGRLGEEINIVYGKNLPTKNLQENGYPVFGGNGQIGFFSKFLYNDQQVLISCRGDASGKVNISLPDSFVTNNSLVLEIPKNSDLNFSFLKFFSLNTDFKVYVSGSAQPQITIETIRHCPILFPSKKMIVMFEEIIKPFTEKILVNNSEIQTLSTLRDTLLPKLMSEGVGNFY
jgi:very-short-patch-repair endonuclease/restriction endonuclease S subunit